LYVAGLAPKAAVKGIVSENTGDKMAWVQTLFTSVARKVIFLVGGDLILRIVNGGYMTESDVNILIDIGLGVLLMGGSASWTKIIIPLWQNRVWPWIEKQIAPVEPPTPKQA
jgi:hypothetical protein